MPKQALLLALITLLYGGSTFAQGGPCSVQSDKLACALPQEFGTGLAFGDVLNPVGQHAAHFSVGTSDFAATIKPLTQDISRQANLLPIASPSSGVVLVYDKSINSFTTATDSLGPVLGERAETVGRHHLFIGFSYQFFNFDKLDGINLNNFPAVLTHTDDNQGQHQHRSRQSSEYVFHLRPLGYQQSQWLRVRSRPNRYSELHQSQSEPIHELHHFRIDEAHRCFRDHSD